jgi:hypothetical protein
LRKVLALSVKLHITPLLSRLVDVLEQAAGFMDAQGGERSEV